MKKIFLPLFMIVISFSFVNAEDLNNSKPMTNEEFLKKMQQQEEKQKDIEKKLKQTREMQKTVDEIKDKLAIDKK
jgi:hypothetical protein